SYIFGSCDMISLDGKPATGSRGSYGHAQKMRASMTHMFSRVCGIGKQSWRRTTSQDGRTRMEGNPSISDKVATYMVSLRRRKVQAGETATSARAITPEILEYLYDYNHLPQNWSLSDDSRLPSELPSDIHQWGGPVCR
ncbi:hypothetical protein GALMADRAFT_47239, partial [Galerina marginata CBS 339.88]